jgi:hypothetical protein
MLVVISITLSAELSVIVREKVSPRAEIKFVGKKALHSGDIFPH